MSTSTADPTQSFQVPGPGGKTFTIKRPNVLRQLKLVEILGPTAENRTYLGMVLPLTYLSAIDGEDEPFPTSKMQLEALVQRLDDEGLTALSDGIKANFAPPETTEEALDAARK